MIGAVGGRRVVLSSRWLAVLGAAALAASLLAVLPPAGAVSASVSSSKDANVRAASPTKNYGSNASLRVQSGSYLSYLGFTVAALTGPVQSAKLRLWVTDASPSGGGVYVVPDGWSETTITYANRPAVPATPVGTFGAVTAGTWAEVDVTSAVQGAGAVSLAIVSTSSNSALYSSREAANAPTLVVTVADGPSLPPVAAFVGAPTSGSSPLAVQFTDTSSGSPTSWAWDFQNDGVVDATVRNPLFTYLAAGSYDVSLRATNAAGGNTTTQFGFVQVGVTPPGPTAAFGVSSQSGRAPFLVQLTDQSTGSITSWAWDFQNDGVVDSVLQSPTFTFTSAGDYTIRLTVTGPGGSSTTTGPGSVIVTPAVGPATRTFAAVADARVRSGGPTSNYGADPVLRARASTSDAYRSFLKFDVSGITGPVSSATLRLWVTDPSPQGGSAWTAGNNWTETGLTWNTMPALGSVALSTVGSVVAGTWQSMDVTNAIAGDGMVTIAMTSSSTDSALWSSREGSLSPELVVVFGTGTPVAPTADFVGLPVSGSSPLTVRFTDLSTGAPTAWAWDFQNDSIVDSMASQPSFTYQTPGTYAVSLTASNAIGSGQRTRVGYITVTEPATGGDGQRLLAAGDIASCSSTGDEATAALLAQSTAEVLALGDLAYENGTASEFTGCYEPSWGAAKARTRPAPGNHEYGTAQASGYFGYFGAAAGDPTKGYYSFERSGWHIVVLNSNCSEVAGCSAGSAQEQWLRADLAAHPAVCTLAAWHHSRFSSSGTAGTTSVQALWQALYDNNAEIVLSGHSHVYERFAPQTATGVLDVARGLRQFTVGTGGRGLVGFSPTISPNSEVRDASSFGVLQLTLGASDYSWTFLPVAGSTFTDSGTGTCHSAPTPVVQAVSISATEALRRPETHPEQSPAGRSRAAAVGVRRRLG